MRVLNVNSTLGLRTGGGTAERTFQMSHSLAKQGIDCTVLTLDIELDSDRINAIKPAKVLALPCFLKRYYLPLANWARIRVLVETTDIIHIMGHWGVLNALVYIAARRAKKPYVVCPAGALPLFGRSQLLKHFYNLIIGHAIIRNASAWMAVTASEFPHFESYGIQSSKITVIPNGVNAEDFPAPRSDEFLQRYGLSDAPIILFLGRLNLIKGPDILLKAFARVHKNLPNYQLVFVGPDGGMLKELQTFVADQGMFGSVHFLDYLEGKDKSAAYHNAKLLVVPSRQEAMSIVALEAGICGTPVLLTDQCGFGEITSLDLRLEVPATEMGIAKGLINLLSDTTELDKISPIWQSFVQARYTWQSIAPVYIDLYNYVLQGEI